MPSSEDSSSSSAEITKSLLDKYGEARTVRSLVQLIPAGFGGAIDLWLMEKLQRIKKDRARIFFDKLDSGDIELSPEIIASDDFLHCFFKTANAALNSRRKEKIELFASLLRSTFTQKSLEDFDEYDELLSILDDISWREWRALILLAKYSESPLQPSDNQLTWSLKFWSDFLSELGTDLGISTNDATSFLVKISRTGLYQEITGSFMDYSGGIGFLTPQFYRLKHIIELDSK